MNDIEQIYFGGAGTLFPYYIGVYKALQENIPDLYKLKFAGTSAGAIIAIFIILKVPPEEVLCLIKRKFVLRLKFDEIILSCYDDEHIQAAYIQSSEKDFKRIRFNISKYTNGTFNSHAPMITKENFLLHVRQSSFIPFVSKYQLLLEGAIDGVLTETPTNRYDMNYKTLSIGVNFDSFHDNSLRSYFRRFLVWLFNIILYLISFGSLHYHDIGYDIEFNARSICHHPEMFKYPSETEIMELYESGYKDGVAYFKKRNLNLKK